MFGEFKESDRVIDPNTAAKGAYVDDLEAFNRAWDAQVKTSSMMGMAKSISDLDSEQSQWLKQQGEIDVPTLDENLTQQYLRVFSKGSRPSSITQAVNVGGGFKDLYRYYGPQGADEDVAKRFESYDTKIEEMKAKYPQRKFMSTRDIFDNVVSAGQKAEQSANDMRGGAVGEFIGGAVASMNPMTDPLNFATMGVGGFGRTAAARIGTEMGAQTVIEGFNQVTGVQDQREAMGLSNGWGDAVSRVGATAIGAGVLQGAGEVIVAGASAAGRRWFKSTPDDPAPAYEIPKTVQRTPEMQATAEANLRRAMSEINPLTRTPEGRARATQDLDFIKSRMEAWDGEAPMNIKPPQGDTAMSRAAEGFLPPTIKAEPNASVDIRARQIDAKTFDVFDRLADEKVALRSQLDLIRPDTAPLHKQVDDLNDRIDAVKNKVERNLSSHSRRTPATEARLKKMEQERDELLAQVKGKDTPPMAAVRDQLMKVDYRMRDMAPQVSRAYAQARGDWGVREQDVGHIQQMIRNGEKEFPRVDNSPLKDIDPDTIRWNDDLTARAPILERSASVEAQMREGADAMDYASAIVKADGEVLDEALDSFRASIKGALESPDGKVSVLGYESKLDLADEITVPNKDGNGERTITVRELLEEQMQAEEDAKAITSCSI